MKLRLLIVLCAAMLLVLCTSSCLILATKHVPMVIMVMKALTLAYNVIVSVLNVLTLGTCHVRNVPVVTIWKLGQLIVPPHVLMVSTVTLRLENVIFVMLLAKLVLERRQPVTAVIWQPELLYLKVAQRVSKIVLTANMETQETTSVPHVMELALNVSPLETTHVLNATQGIFSKWEQPFVIHLVLMASSKVQQNKSVFSATALAKPVPLLPPTAILVQK